MMLREARKRKLEAQEVSWEEEEPSTSLDAEPHEPCYSSDEDSRRGKSAISWTGALEARFLKALQQAGGVWEAKPKAILQRMGAYSTQLTTIQVKSHLQKHRIKVAAQMQAQGLPVPSPSNGGSGATPAVAAAAQQVAAARAAQLQSPQAAAQQRVAPPKARRPKAPPAGSVVSAEPVLAPPARRAPPTQPAAKAATARHAQQQQQQQQQLARQQQQYAAAVQRRQLVAERQQQQQQWATGGLAAPATPQQMRFDSPGVQQLVEVEAAPGPLSLGHSLGHSHAHHSHAHHSHAHHSHGHGQLAHHAVRALHPSQHGGYGGHGGLEMHGMHGMAQLAPAGACVPPQLDPAAGPSPEGSPVTAGSSGGAPAGSAGSDWEALLRMDQAPSPHMLAASKHGSLLRLHGGGMHPASGMQHGHGMQQYGSAGTLAVHPSAATPPPLATHPTAPASLWATAAPVNDGWPQLGGPVGVPQPGMPAPHAVAMLAPPPGHHHATPATAPNHTSDSDSDHYADLGDLLDMPALLAGGHDAFDALAAGLGSPGGGAAGGGLPGHPSAASSWAINTSPFF
ncbi:hypothetical protein ABPG75_003903 [Micractinium tetrahymenae]